MAQTPHTPPTHDTAVASDRGAVEDVSALPRNDCGAFGMRIGADGTWYYQDSPIGRIALVKLFATVLSRDDDGVYWLTTPVEHGTIEVEDAPFVAVEMDVEGSGHDQVIRLRTNLEDWVEVDEDHPLRVSHDDATGEPSPYVYVRKGLEAKINRSVYYDLVALAVEGKGDGSPSGSENGMGAEGDSVGVWSKGRFFLLGTL